MLVSLSPIFVLMEVLIYLIFLQNGSGEEESGNEFVSNLSVVC